MSSLYKNKAISNVNPLGTTESFLKTSSNAPLENFEITHVDKIPSDDEIRSIEKYSAIRETSKRKQCYGESSFEKLLESKENYLYFNMKSRSSHLIFKNCF